MFGRSRCALLGAVVALSALAIAPAGAATPPARAWRGRDAIARLGSRLSTIASRHHVSATRLEHMLRTDSTLSIDANDRLFYTDPASTPNTAPAAESGTAGTPATDAFALHSRPGSAHVIYLDFDGQNVTGTAWTAYTGNKPCDGDPFNADGSPTTFSTNERNIIHSVWARVAEDYAPFDVDVTTQDPGTDAIHRSDSSDTHYGMRALITSATTECANHQTLWESVCGAECGGLAYVGVFNQTGSLGDANQPALIFSDAELNDAKNIGDAVAHEVGHTLGLDHDGLTSGCLESSCEYFAGHGAWAPIMGIGYDEPITQWSKGEYDFANNQQDDLAVIRSYGLDLVPDDHGDTTPTATNLSTPAFATDGLIGTRTDVDVFAVNAGAGPATFTVTPSLPSPDLDVKLELRDGLGNVIATDDPASLFVSVDVADGVGASITTTLAAGRYSLVVDGVGSGDPGIDGYSDYASLGRYHLAGAVTAPDPAQFVAPDAPTGVSAAPRNGAVHVAWTAPAHHGTGAITDGVVSVFAADGGPATGVTGATSRAVGSAANAFDFNGLTNGTTYLFKVAAASTAGTSALSSGATARPDGVAPTATTARPAGRWTLTTAVATTWSATDSGSGIAGYDVERRSGAFDKPLGAYAIWKSATAVTSSTFNGTRGATYCIRARARDNAMNVSAYTGDRCTAIPLAYNQLGYSTGWVNAITATAYAGGLRGTVHLNASVFTPKLVGKRFVLVATTCAACGIVRVYWNGVYKGTINLHTTSTRRKQVLTLLTFASVATGKLKLVVASTKPVFVEGIGVSKI